jgi:prefoldin subunit 2
VNDTLYLEVITYMARQVDLQAQYNAYKNQLQQIAAKIGDLETEVDEHSLVISSISELPPQRKAFRMIGGVLVEKTVGEVIPALKTNQEGIKGVMESLVRQYKNTEEEFGKFQKDNKIKVVRQ